jgi:ribosomal-protein-alanine N-acetyltransferase
MNWKPGALLELETERFVIRTMTREDVSEDFLAWLADPEVMLGLNIPRRRLARDQAVRWVLAHDNRSAFCLAICLRADDRQIGFFTVHCDPKHQTADTSVVVGDRDWWGKDVVMEGRTALLDFLFDRMHLHKVTGRPHGRNFSSIYNYKALGFRCEAVLREQLRSIQDDTRLDQLVFGILRDEWHSRREERRP